MQYVIDEVVLFRSEDGTMWPLDREEEKIILSPVVARLLTYLLNERGKILTREEIMYHTWTIHGLEPSGNSLNQYISQLRKNFSNFGLHSHVIQTLPRIGFIFSEEVKVEIHDIYSVSEIEQEALSTNNDTKGGSGFSKYMIYILIMLLMFAVPFLVEKAGEQWGVGSDKSVPVDLGRINECNVYGIGMQAAMSVDMAHKLAENILDQYKITCDQKDFLLFSMQGGVLHNKPGRVFISICNDNKGQLTSCRNKLYNSWN